ncbi:acetate kinase [Sedimentitalea sp. CY04]|uniref:Acetate kinase n=1 Tax=Parasedimentitalea denitrificans TaxID=2211118 RepID=A0ABX0WC34_9RHOB|nr:acetate/propionate family kinase [Sedimentitalea sp. CY04]NIZ62225.1 acetate kinase [Sedimentitalea sp. CY04]
MDAILVINAGSSSLKFQIFSVAGYDLFRQIRGQIDGIGVRPRLRATGANGEALIDQRFAPEDVPDLPSAITETRTWLNGLKRFRIRAIGHRVVHGGPDYDEPVLIDPSVLKLLASYQDLAPLHQPNNLAPIQLAIEIAPDVPQVVCFDTAFHRCHDEIASSYALPSAFYEEGVRRYGFHGLSYEYITGRLGEIAPDAAAGKVIVAHLGSGASMCAVSDGCSIESTMGFTALDGLPMGTRSGQLDPGVVLHLITAKGMSVDAVSDLLYNESGLKGLSGQSSDMRDLLASNNPRAAFAVDHFVYRSGMMAGMLAAALGGLDAFVFTAGVGENSPKIRALITEKLGWLGVEIDHAANKAGATCFSTPASSVALYVIPTDEELVIARHTLAVVSKGVQL